LLYNEIVKKFLNRFIHNESGQSLMEIIVGLSIGAILIGTASIGIAFVLRSTSINQNLATASQLTQGLLSNVQTFANSNWQNVYGLTKGSGAQYFLSASGTSYMAVNGQEGTIDNDVANGLIGEWKFDENITSTSTVTYDATGNNNTGTLYSGVTRTSSGCKISNCLSFDGTSGYVRILDASTFDILNFTLFAWVRTTSTAAVARIISQQDATYYWVLSVNSGYLTTYLSLDGVSATKGPLLSDGQWHQIAISRDTVNDVITWWVDGVSVGTQSTANNSIYTVANDVYIGAYNGASQFFTGPIDDVRIYNRALSASEVKQLYNSQTFSRYFYVDNVCRTNDSLGSIASSSSPCSGGSADDPLTQKVTAVTNWLVGASLDQVSLARYVTRWGNFAIRQTDWSGGTGQEGPLTAPNSSYSSSTNISSTGTLGSFKINGLGP